MQRILFSVALFISILFLPWWISLLLALLFLFMIERYYEIVVFGLAMDILYSSSMSLVLGLFHIPLVFFLCSIILLGCVELLKTKLIFYRYEKRT